MTDYGFLCRQLCSLSENVTEQITILSNTAALLSDALPDLNWAGFYILCGNELTLGPFVGKPACVKITLGKGVCGTAAERNETIVVPDVHAFPGHIACDSASNSEIVLPIHVGGKLFGVLDIDSPLYDRFTSHDKEGLESFVGNMEKILSLTHASHGTHTSSDIVLDAIRERRSIRRFKSDMPRREDIEKIIEAGLYAASGKGLQATVTIAVTNKEFRDMLAADNASFWSVETPDPFFCAPVILIVLGNKKRPTYLYDGSLVIGNMMLAAHALGLGSIWIHRAKQEFETPKYKRFLEERGILGEWEGVGHCCVGYIDGEPPTAANRRKNRVFWVD